MSDIPAHENRGQWDSDSDASTDRILVRALAAVLWLVLAGSIVAGVLSFV